MVYLLLIHSMIRTVVRRNRQFLIVAFCINRDRIKYLEIINISQYLIIQMQKYYSWYWFYFIQFFFKDTQNWEKSCFAKNSICHYTLLNIQPMFIRQIKPFFPEHHIDSCLICLLSKYSPGHPPLLIITIQFPHYAEFLYS